MEAAPTIKVSIKWNKQVFEDVELNLADDITTFKGQVYALSNVPVEKQKLMAKGKQVGQVTSAATSPDFGGSVAIGMVRMTHWDDGTELTVETPDGPKGAIVKEKFWI